jgi:hypothetical protein
MKMPRQLASALAAAALALASSTPQTQAQVISNTFVFNFPTTGPTEAAFNSAWISWYNSPGNNTPIMVDPSTGVSSPVPGSNTGDNGSLEVISPLAGGTQNVFFGTFANDVANPYDFSTLADTTNYASISFDMLVAPGTPLNTNDSPPDYGTIGVGIINTSYAYKQLSEDPNGVTIPASASTVWYHVSVPILQSQDLGDVPGICLDLNSYGGYPLFTTTNWIANIAINQPPAATYPDFVSPTFQFATSNDVAPIYGADNADSFPTPFTTTAWYTPGTGTNFVEWSTNTPPYAPTGGSLYVASQFEPGDNNLTIFLPFDTNWMWYADDTNVVINLYQYTAINLDVMWDTNNSTISIDTFNAAGDINGFPIGTIGNPPLVNDETCGSTTTFVPDAASNGWVHISCPLNNLKPADNQCIGLWFKKYVSSGSAGTVAFWVDNITFTGGIIPSHPNQPTLSIAKPVPGLQCNFTGTAGNAQYDREMICTGNSGYTFVDAGPVTYSMSIGYSGTTTGGAWLALDQNGTETEPDWVDPSIIVFSIANNAAGATVTEMVKTNNANENGDLYDASDPVFTTKSSVLGTWSFTITGNTNILCTAPDGETTNLPIGLSLTSAEVESIFPVANGMYVYFGAMGGGAASEGSRWVITKSSVSGAVSTPLSENWVAEANTGSGATGGQAGPAGSGGNTLPGQNSPWTGNVSGFLWNDTSDSSTSRGIYLLGTNTPFVLDWTAAGGNGATVLTNATLNPNTWGTNTALTTDAYLEATYFSSEVDATNLPPDGDFFFSLVNSPQ